jgi:hypothetical protein
MRVPDQQTARNGSLPDEMLATLHSMQDRLRGTEIPFDEYLHYLHYLRDKDYCAPGGVSTSNKGRRKAKEQESTPKGKGKGKGKEKEKEKEDDGISRPHWSHVPLYNRTGKLVEKDQLHRSKAHELIGYHLSSAHSITTQGGSMAVTGWVSDSNLATHPFFSVAGTDPSGHGRLTASELRVLRLEAARGPAVRASGGFQSHREGLLCGPLVGTPLPSPIPD